MKITVETEFKVAEESLDHISPSGAVLDNRSNQDYINSVKRYFNKPSISVLDLGCAGGQLVVDFINQGDLAVGIEGSTTVLGGAGQENWRYFLNKNLFFADLTKPYQIYFNETPAKFDFIHSWEVIEHIDLKDLSNFFSFIKQHLSDDGVFCCSIALYPSYGKTPGPNGEQIDLHVSQFNPAKWLNIIYQNGFELCVDPSWPPMPQKDVPFGRSFDKTMNYNIDADEGIIQKDQGLFFGYLFKDSMYRNHDCYRSSIYLCLRKAEAV